MDNVHVRSDNAVYYSCPALKIGQLVSESRRESAAADWSDAHATAFTRGTDENFFNQALASAIGCVDAGWYDDEPMEDEKS